MATKPSRRRREWPWLRSMAASSLVVASLSAIFSWLGEDDPLWAQWSLLIHLGAGLSLLLLLIPFIVQHFRRVGLSHKGPVFSSGLIAILLFLPLAASGLYTAFVGIRHLTIWISELHSYIAIGFIVLLLLHAWTYRKITSASVPKTPFLSIKILFFITAGLAIGIASLTVAENLFTDRSIQTEPSDTPYERPYERPYGEAAFAPSLTETTGFIDLKRFQRSSQCSECHADITRQWTGSMHALAAADPAYVKNIDLLVENKGMAAARYCEGCHAPLALLSGQLTEGGQHGGTEGTIPHDEGVTCLICHGTSHITSTEGVASYRYEPPRPYLFDQTSGYLAVALNRLVLRLSPERHKTDMGRPLLKKAEFCASCHEQFMDENINKWGWIKLQQDYSSWLKSPYSKQQATPFREAQQVTCQQCHMPPEPGSDPAQSVLGQTKGHGFQAANTAIPTLLGNHAGAKKAEAFLQANRIRLSIDEPRPNRTLISRQHLAAELSDSVAESGLFFLGDRIRFNIHITNIGVGHAFPGGTTDINEAWLAFRVTDAEGQAVADIGSLDKQGRVDPTARFFRTTPIDKHGKPVVKHDLFNAVGETDRSTIAPGETDSVPYEIDIPYWAKSPLTVTATLRYRKFNRAYTNFALGPNIVLPIVDVVSDTIVLDLAHTPHRFPGTKQ